MKRGRANQLSVLLRLVFIILLEIGLLVYAMFQGGFISWFVFYSSLPFFLNSIYTFFFPFQKLSIERVIRMNRHMSGETMNVQLTIRNRMFTPFIYLIIEDVHGNDSQLNVNNGKKVIYLKFKQTFTYEYKISNVPRGEYVFMGVRLMTTDLLGLLKKEYMYPLDNHVLVYPQLQNIPFSLVNLSSEYGQLKQNQQWEESHSELHNVRKYQSGDRMSYIDWKATARTGEMMSREFDIKESSNLTLILDGKQDEFLEERIILTASLVEKLIKKGYIINFEVFASMHIRLPATNSVGQFERIYECLAKIDGRMEGKQTELSIDNRTIYITSDNDIQFKNGSKEAQIMLYIVNEDHKHNVHQMYAHTEFIHPNTIKQVIIDETIA